MSSEYDRKFDEMKKYIPFLESMIKRLESTSGSSSNPRLAQLDKIRSLRDLLLDKKKRMKMENLLKCEQVLINLYAKVEQRDALPSIKKNPDNIFDLDSPTSKEKTNLDSVRNKLKAVSKQQEEGTLPEIARANQIEETTVGKEPALFQRRPNKSPIRHPPSNYMDEKNHPYNNQNSKRNYTRVLVSPEKSPSRRPTESTNKVLYKRRSPKMLSRDYSPSHHKRDRKKSFKQDGTTLRKIRDFNITLNVPEESLESLNTEDILSRIINCSDSDVDIHTLRELRSQILGELKETGTSNDISDLLLKSYKQTKKKADAQKVSEIEEGELSDSESEAIESIYGSLVVVDKDTKVGNEPKKLAKSDAPRKIQICLVINSEKEDPDIKYPKDNSVDISDFDLFYNEPTLSNGEQNKYKTEKTVSNTNTTNNVRVKSDSATNKSMDSAANKSIITAPIDIDIDEKNICQIKEEIKDTKHSTLNEVNNKNTAKMKTENITINDIKSGNRLILNKDGSKNNTESIPESGKNSVQFKANFYKPLNDEESTEKNYTPVSKISDKTDEIPSSKDEIVVSNASLESKTAELEKILSAEKNVDIPLLNEPSVPKKPEEKTIVSEIDILQALKNEILSETIAIPGAETTTPPLHQPKLIKVSSAKEIMPKKRISIEKYKEKSVTTTVKNMLRKDCETNTVLANTESVKKTKIKLTEKECERFNLPSRLSLDDQISSDDEAEYNSDILIEDVYGDLAPKSPDDMSLKEMDISPPIIIPEDPVKETLVAPKADVDMRTLPSIISPNSSIDSNSSNAAQNKEPKDDNLKMQQNNMCTLTKKLPLDPRIRKELLKTESPNPNSTPERTLRPAPFSNPAMTPIMTPNSRTYEMTPTHRSFEVDIPPNSKHVYAPFASSFEVYDTRENSVSSETGPVWDLNRTSEERSARWEENKDNNRDRNTNLREPYQTKRRDESSYRKGPTIERYKIDRREEFRPDNSSTPAFGLSDNSITFRRMEAPTTPVVDFGGLDSVTTPSHTFGRSECPTTPSHPFGRSDCPTTPSHPFGRSDCPTTPSHPFGRSDCPTTPSHPFGRSDCPATPSHPFGRSDIFDRNDLSMNTHRSFSRSEYSTTPSHPFSRSDCPATPSHSFGRSDCPTTPIHPYGRSDCPTTPSHPFGRIDCPATPSHSFGRSDCPTTPSHHFGRLDYPTTPSHPFGRWKDSDYDDGRESGKYRETSYDRKKAYGSQKRYSETDSWSHRRDNRLDQEDNNRYIDHGRNYNKDQWSEHRGTGERPWRCDDISGNYRERRGGYDSSSRSFEDFRSTNKSHDQNTSRYARDDPRTRQRATSVGRNNCNEVQQNKMLSVQPEAGRSFKIDTSVNTTFQNFIVSKGLQMISETFDARRTRATSVGRSLQRESSVGRSLTPKPAAKIVISNYDKIDRYKRASSVGRDCATGKSDRCFKDLKADFEAFKEKITIDVKKPRNTITNTKGDKIQQSTSRCSRYDTNEQSKSTKSIYSPTKNIRDPRMQREYKNSDKNSNKCASYKEFRDKKTHGIIYSSDNIAKGTVLGSNSGVRNYKIPKLKSVIEEKEREERLKREKEEQERKEKEEKERREKELKEKLAREKKEKEEREKEEQLRLQKEERERKLREEKERKEKLERERKERMERLEREKKEKIERLEMERIEKDRLEREKIEVMKKEKKEKEEKERQEYKEKEERDCNEIVEQESRGQISQKSNVNEDNSKFETDLKDSENNLLYKDGLLIISDRKSTLSDGENNDLDSPTKRITRSRAKMVNLDSSDEIKPKRLTKSFVFESDSDLEDSVPVKNKISIKAKPKESTETSPVKNKKQAQNKQDDFQTTFEVDELFGDNVASDPVIDNINALIADLDNDIDTSKTDSTETFKNEISLENMLENITSSQENNFKESSNSNNTISSCAEDKQDIIEKDIPKIDNTRDKITTGNLNMEHIVTTSVVPESDIKVCEKISDSLNDRSNDGCSTPDSTIIGDALLEKPNEVTSVKEYSNESNSDVTSTLDTVESSVKDNVEPSSSHKDLSSLDSIGNLLSILQDKSRIKELLTMLKDTDNDKMKKKLEKLSELVSDDDDDTNDVPENIKSNSDPQNKSVLENSDCSKKDIGDSGKNLDTSQNYDTLHYLNTNSISEELSKETACIKDIDKNDKEIVGEVTKDIIEKNISDGESKSSEVEDKPAQVQNNSDNLETNENVLVNEKLKKISPVKKNIPPKNSKGKFVKKSVPQQKEVIKNQNKPKRKKSELQKLQQDIKEMFERDDILNTTGIRMCRIAKLVDKNDAEQKEVFQDPKPVVILNKYVDPDKADATPPVKIRNKPGPKPKQKLLVEDNKLKNITQKPGPKSKTKSQRKEDSDPYAFETDSISESTKTIESDTESDTSDSENCSLASSSKSFSSNEVLLDIKKKKRKRGSWQTGVIRAKNKNNKKQVEQKQFDQTDDLMLPPRDIAIPDLNCFVDKTYCFQNGLETYSCRLCVYTGTDIILHYKQKHPHTEIPLSRFNSKTSKEAIEQSETINFQAFSKIPSKSYTCRFCYKEFIKSQAVLEKFFWHVVSTHTGEYKQSCSECVDANQCPFNLDIPPPPKDSNGQLIGYICEKCNFTQISLENLKTHVIVRHNDEQTVVYTVNLSAMSKKKLNSFIRRCNATNSRNLRSNRSINNSVAEASGDPTDVVDNETDTTPSRKPSHDSPVKSNSPGLLKQIQSKITFESEDIKTERNDVPIKIETVPTDNNTEFTESDTVLEDPPANQTEINDDSENLTDIKAIAHFKVSYKETGGMEYVCCINNDAHFRTVKLISLKQHARKHTEDWDGFCVICKVIVTPQGVHKFNDCLQHFIDIHMGEFPVMERAAPPELDPAHSPVPVDTSTPPKPYINVRPLSDLISKNIDEFLPEHTTPSPVIESVVSLTQAVERPRASPSYPSTALEKLPEKALKYEEWQAVIMSKKHRVVLATMMTKGNLIKVFKCAGRFCSFTSDSAEEALLHASTHQRIGGEGAMNCAYCDFDTSDNAIDLVMHVFKAHGRCQYACALCFYRAAASQLVGAHIANAHPNFTAEGNVLRTTSITAAVPEDSNVLPRDKAVPYYVCAQQDSDGNQPCKFRTYAPGKFCEHLNNSHNEPYSCAECKESARSSSDLIIHMKSHGFRLYQCTWCVHGAEKEADLISHVASKHPDKQPQAYIRIITNKDGSSEYRVLPLAYLNKSKVPTEDVTPSKTDDPIREADRSLELEKLIGQTALLLNTAGSIQDPIADLQPSISEHEQSEAQMDIAEPVQPTETLKASFLSSPIASASSPIVPRSVQSVTSPSVSTSSIQSVSQPNQSAFLPTTNIVTPSLSITTLTVPTQAISSRQSVTTVSQANTVTPVIKIEPLESVQTTDVVESDDDVINVSDDEPETEKINELVRDMLLKCPGCKAVYISISAFMKHVLENGHAVGAIVCPHAPCSRSVSTLKELIEHYHRDHVNTDVKQAKTRFKCDLCGLYCLTLAETKVHLKVDHQVSKMWVTALKDTDVYVVGEEGSKRDSDNAPDTSAQPSELATITPLQQPVSTPVPAVTGQIDDRAVQVPKVEPTEPSVADVVLSDSDDDPKQTDVIDLSDDETSKYIQIHLVKLMKCPKCHMIFKNMAGLLRHMGAVKHLTFPMKCPHTPCATVISGVPHLRVHYKRDHNADKASEKGQTSFTCEVCKTAWSTFDLAKRHMARIHEIKTVDLKATKKKDTYTVCSADGKGQARAPKPAGKEAAKVKLVYAPEEIDRLPIKPILDKSVRCSLCSFNTKVRVNMARHLQLHLSRQLAPQTAPVNPVPHLETNEKHFDKMVNLASSSIMTRPERAARADAAPAPASLVPPEAAAKYPRYVPERQRLTCGAKGCSYISVDEAMLRRHWETLHAGTNDYHCVHCPPYQHLDTSRELTATRIITHLKMHDAALYACPACPYYHYVRGIVEKHLADAHGGVGGDALVVREEAPSAAPAQPPPAPTMDLKPWQCGLCKFKSMLHPNIVEHCSKLHNSKMQFKCDYCPFRTSTLENVTKHQANAHAGKAENVFYYYYREGSIPDEPDGTPRWARQRQRMPEHVVKTEAPEGPAPVSEPAPAPVASTPGLTVDLNKVKKEAEEQSEGEVSMQELCKRYGEFCEPNGLRYKCSLCKVVCVDSREDMESHLYEELHYRKWGCGLCSYKAFHLAGLTEHMAAEHGPKRQEAIRLPVDGNLERWVQAYLNHQAEYIKNSRKSLDELKQAASKAMEALVVPIQKAPEVQCQYTHEELIKAFGTFGAASDGKYCCPKCDFVSTEYDVIKGHLEGELGKIRWTCSTCNEHFLTYHQAQYHCRSVHPTVSSRPNPVARQQDIRTAWINAVIDTQKQALSGTPAAGAGASDKNELDQTDNSLLVVRYEESVNDQEQPQNRKRPASDSEDDTLVIDEPEKKKRIKSFKCRYCGHVMTNAYNLNYHQLRHFNLFPLMCRYCKFTGLRHMVLNHMATVHPSLPVSYKQTELPDGPPLVLSKVQSKRQREDSMICLYCEQAMSSSESLNHRHGNVKPEFSTVGLFVMQCSICHMLFANASSLEDHHIETHPDMPANAGSLHEVSAAKEPIRCNVCDKMFTTRKDLYVHQRNEHITVAMTNETPGQPSPKRVARKSTTKLPRGNAVARKSTTKLPYSIESEEYSYYGTKPSMNEYDHVTTLMPFCNTIMSFTVKKLKEIINISPNVFVTDLNNTKQVEKRDSNY